LRKSLKENIVNGKYLGHTLKINCLLKNSYFYKINIIENIDCAQDVGLFKYNSSSSGNIREMIFSFINYVLKYGKVNIVCDFVFVFSVCKKKKVICKDDRIKMEADCIICFRITPIVNYSRTSRNMVVCILKYIRIRI
jgi:hypothetical protein